MKKKLIVAELLFLITIIITILFVLYNKQEKYYLKSSAITEQNAENYENELSQYFSSKLNVSKDYMFFYSFSYGKDGIVIGDSVSAILKKDYYDKNDNNMHKLYLINSIYYSAKILNHNQAYCILTNRINSNRKDSICNLSSVPVGNDMKQILDLINSKKYKYPPDNKNDKTFVSCKIEDNVNTCKVTSDTFFVNWEKK